MQDLIRHAAKMLAKSKHHEFTKFRHISYVMQNGVMLSYGWNHRHDNPPPMYRDRNTVHAEYHAFMRAKRLRMSKPWFVVNIRFNAFYELRQCAPCVKCRKFLTAVGCEKVLEVQDADGSYFTHHLS